MKNEFTAVFQKHGTWWVGYAEELPGANTQGATLDEARENLREAVTMVLQANRQLARRRPRGGRIVREGLTVSHR
jgi:predicted RNase H-like HicB family nuclease